MQNYPQPKIPDIRSVLDQSREVLISLGRNPSFDAAASGLSLYLALSSLGKRVTIVAPSAMTVEFNHLIGVDKISNNLSSGGRNLVVSFPYQEGSIEKVSYNIENDIFNLVIEPREGYPTITPDKLNYSFGGGTFDLIMVVNAPSLNDLDTIYSQNQNLFNEKQVINIDNNSANQRYGKINFVDQNASSVSEVVTKLLNSWGLRMDADIATNLLAGITSGSNNFTSPLSGVATFEAASICMKNGARKLSIDAVPTYNQPQVQSQPYQFPTQPNNFQSGYQSTNMNQPMDQVSPVSRPVPQPRMPSQPLRQPMPAPRMQPKAQQPRQPVNNQPAQQKKTDQAPPDWLKPKIYKGSTLL